ncbi:MAG: RidA family protein [Ignavibacteriae bacterium]|nr:RidA family protein [Ignavibacteriota bacterium]
MKYLVFILCFILSINLSAKDKKVILSDKSPKPIGPYSQAIKVGSTIYLSGQIALDTATGTIAEGGAAKEAEIILNNLKNVLEAANCTFENVVKTTIYLTDMKDFNPVNKVYASFFTIDFPARETVQVAALPMGAHVEISMIAVK